MKFTGILASCLAGVLFLSSCAETQAPAVPSETVPELTETAGAETLPRISPEEEILAGMTLREKVGQLFLIRPDALDFSIPFETLDNSAVGGMIFLSDTMKETLRDYPVGGFVHFKKNIVNPKQLKEFNDSLRSASKIPPFIAADEEGGLVSRLASNDSFGLPKFESAAAVGSKGPEAAQKMGLIIGEYLQKYGFNMDFAPVADVNTNPGNPVIGKRAFSADPQQAAAAARAMADGLRMNGILPVFKHFPGHGDTAEDSHKKLAVSKKTEEQLLSCEWIPFMQAEARECIMIGHIALPEVTGDMTPATFSPKVISDYLREKLGYQGLVITDSLSMGAVLKEYTSQEAALMALNAGNDLLLMPASLPDAFNGIVEAVENGSFSTQELDEIVLRILRTKIDYHIIEMGS